MAERSRDNQRLRIDMEVEINRIKAQREVVDEYLRNAGVTDGLGYALIRRRLDNYRDRQIADLHPRFVGQNIENPLNGAQQ